MSSQSQTKALPITVRKRTMVQGDFSGLACQHSRTRENEVSSERVIESARNLVERRTRGRLFREALYSLVRHNESFSLAKRSRLSNCSVDCSETSDFLIIHWGVVITLIVP